MSRNLLDYYRDFYSDKDSVFVARDSEDSVTSLYTKYDIANGRCLYAALVSL
jgi:hypothetical protein